jgi:hypothetical protein
MTNRIHEFIVKRFLERLTDWQAASRRNLLTVTKMLRVAQE